MVHAPQFDIVLEAIKHLWTSWLCFNNVFRDEVTTEGIARSKGDKLKSGNNDDAKHHVNRVNDGWGGRSCAIITYVAPSSGSLYSSSYITE